MDVFLQLIADGVTECGQIAQEMKVSPATVSRLAKQAFDAGRIKKVNREYMLTEGT
jgi:Mn-dependent DtxR family transcriptional regulator